MVRFAYFDFSSTRRNISQSKPTDTPIETIYFFTDYINMVFVWVNYYFMYIIRIIYIIRQSKKSRHGYTVIY
jgi:hypothetical protein